MAAKTEEELLRRLMENSSSASPYKEFYITSKDTIHPPFSMGR